MTSCVLVLVRFASGGLNDLKVVVFEVELGSGFKTFARLEPKQKYGIHHREMITLPKHTLLGLAFKLR
jgi:hypothetical protein